MIRLNRFVMTGIGLMLAIATNSAFAMTPGSVLSIGLDCSNGGLSMRAAGQISLTRLADGAFHAGGQYQYWYQYAQAANTTPDEDYENTDGYWVVVRQQRQQPQVQYQAVDWRGPRVASLKEAVTIFNQRFLDQGLQCRFVSDVEVKNW